MTDEKLKMANNIRHVLYSYEHEIKMLENAMVDGQRISLHVIDWRVGR